MWKVYLELIFWSSFSPLSLSPSSLSLLMFRHLSCRSATSIVVPTPVSSPLCSTAAGCHFSLVVAIVVFTIMIIIVIVFISSSSSCRCHCRDCCCHHHHRYHHLCRHCHCRRRSCCHHRATIVVAIVVHSTSLSSLSPPSSSSCCFHCCQCLHHCFLHVVCATPFPVILSSLHPASDNDDHNVIITIVVIPP